MNTKTIYALLTIVAIAALAAFLEVQPPKKDANPLVTKQSSNQLHSLTVDTNLDLENILAGIHEYKKSFGVFYDEIFTVYRTATGQNLKVLGEAVSYSGEIKSALETLPTIVLLEGLAKNKKDAGLVAQNWIGRTKSEMDMHLYFTRRLASDNNVSVQTSEMLDKLAHQLDIAIRLLNNISQVLNASSGSAPSAAQNAAN